jgi:hypothetical protein
VAVASILQKSHELADLPIPMKSPGHSEMMPPMDSDMMSPRARASLAAEL